MSYYSHKKTKKKKGAKRLFVATLAVQDKGCGPLDYERVRTKASDEGEAWKQLKARVARDYPGLTVKIFEFGEVHMK